MRNTIPLIALIAIARCADVAVGVDERPGSRGVAATVSATFASRCIDCHGADTAEGDVRLDTFAKLSLSERLDLLNKVQEQVFLGQMPPEDEEQPTDAERTRLLDWLSKELMKHNASKLEGKLKKPEYGNFVDHDKLFSGEYADRP
ncbi:MAG: hypothetical protein MI757_22660, partial [Pirellulales bacterium]|nr:hypothetical protein [Pirellulales bacterium]